MTINIRKKYITLLSTSLFIILVIFSYFFTNKVFAAGLEVKYPTLQTGATVTPQSDLTEYLKYVFDFGIFLGFLSVFFSLTWAGILYFLSPAIPSARADAKDRIAGAISGLLILVLLYLIITTINPYLAIFKTDKLDAPPPVEINTQATGVNFYKSRNCSGIADTEAFSIPDFGDLKNRINSVSIVDSPEEEIYYISVLYDNINYWGKCQYVDPNADCTPVEPFAASASVYPFDFEPNGSGVVLYRKSFNGVGGKEENKNGGFLRITNSQIKNDGSNSLYIAELKKLRFTGESSNYERIKDCTVPKGEQDCAKWDNKDKCVEKQCPNLAGENISSIEINGNYIVLLIYSDELDKNKPWWTYCQAFPKLDDKNKDGPQQIKWDAVRSRGQNPNLILIIPVNK